MRIRICVSIMFLLCVAISANAQSQPGASAPKQQQPSVEDQLALVRLRGQMADARVRSEQGRQIYDQAQRDLKEWAPRLDAILSAIAGKLPKPAVGKMWQPRDDGQMGVMFAEVDALPSEAPNAVIEKPPAVAQQPAKASSDKPRE